MATRPPRTRSHTLRLFLVDAAMLAVFLLVLNVPLTGLAVHEWLGIAIGVGVTTHLVQHTNWVVSTTKRFFGATSFRNRLNYLMMPALFIGFVAVIASGLVISEVALPWLGIETAASDFWLWLHVVSVGWVIWLTALHLALNWKWVGNAVKRFVVGPIRRLVVQPLTSMIRSARAALEEL